MASAGIGTDVEGFHAVAAAAAAGRVHELLVESGRLRDERYGGVVAAVDASGGRVDRVDDVRDHAVTSAPQGLVARCRPIAPVTLEQAIAATSPTSILALDHVEDPRNVGAIARSALAAGIGALVVAADRAAPLGASAFKAAAGTLESLPVAVVKSIADAVRRLEKADVWTIGLDGTAERSLFELDLLAQPMALVIGAEGRGLSRLVGDRVSVRARLPMAGPVESLNASVAASLAVFEVARVRGSLR